MATERVMTAREVIEHHVKGHYQDIANVLGFACRGGEWAVWHVQRDEPVPILAAIRIGDWGLYDDQDIVDSEKAARSKLDHQDRTPPERTQ